MKPTLLPIINVEELKSIYSKANVIIIDASNGPNAIANFNQKHLKGALFIDINSHLAEIKENLADGGRHPLPNLLNFSKTLGEFGISENSHIVIYDDKNGANAAARFWWMLKAIGHEKVQVLNGGFKEAEKQNFPMSSELPKHTKTTPYNVTQWNLPIATLIDVEKASEEKNQQIIDVRESARYNGITEPIDLIAGHIPNAINIPFSENLNEDGLFLSPSELKKKYKIFDANNTIVHCGSGVTACHTLLAFSYAQLPIPTLYVGSWSEWSRNNKNMITS